MTASDALNRMATVTEKEAQRIRILMPEMSQKLKAQAQEMRDKAIMLERSKNATR